MPAALPQLLGERLAEALAPGAAGRTPGQERMAQELIEKLGDDGPAARKPSIEIARQRSGADPPRQLVEQHIPRTCVEGYGVPEPVAHHAHIPDAADVLECAP